MNLKRVNRPALFTALFFCVVGLMWIFLSDMISVLLFPEFNDLVVFQIVKGSFFILATSLLIYSLVRKQLRNRVSVINDLERHNNMLGSLLDGLPALDVLVLDKSGQIVYIKPNGTLLANFENESSLNKNYADVGFSYDLIQYVGFQMEAARDGLSCDNEKFLLNNWYQCIVKIMDALEGGFYYLFAFYDITQQKHVLEKAALQAEESKLLHSKYLKLSDQLQSSLDKYLTLFNDGIYVAFICELNEFGRAGKIIEGNHLANKTLGVTKDNISYIDLRDFLWNDSQTGESEFFNHDFNAVPELNVFTNVVIAGRSVLTVEMRCRKYVFEGKTTVCVTFKECLASTDFDEQIVKSANMFSNVVGYLDEGIVCFNNEYKCNFWNATMTNMFDKPEHEVLGSSLLDVFNAFGESNTKHIVDKALNGQLVTSEEFQFMAFPTKWFESLCLPYYENNIIKGGIRFIRDISERKRKELELANQKAIITDLTQSKNAIIANISHRIRTPMNAIVGFADLLGLEDDKDTIQQHASIIKERSDDLLQNINEMVDVSLLESNQLEFTDAWFSVSDWFSELKNWAKNYCSQTSATLSLVLDSANIADFKSLKFYFDQQRFDQMVKYLLRYTCKNSNDGSVTLSIFLDDKNRFVISLTERGSKNAYSLERLSQQSLSNIYNTDSADTAGLGLYIANGFVTKMNGQLYINSLEDKGSKIEVFLTIPTNRDDSVVGNSNMTSEFKSKFSKALIIEDVYENSELLSEILTHFGVKSVVAGNGTDGIELFHNEKDIEIVFCDIRLPDIDGFQILKALKRMNAAIPVIAQTAYVMQNDRQKCLEAGFTNYISKPLNFDMIQKVLL